MSNKYEELDKESFIEIINDMIGEDKYDLWKKLEDDYIKYKNNDKEYTFFNKVDEVLKSRKIDLRSKRNLFIVKNYYNSFLEYDKFCDVITGKIDLNFEEKKKYFSKISYLINLRKKEEAHILRSIFPYDKEEIIGYLDLLEDFSSKNIFNKIEGLNKQDIDKDIDLLLKLSDVLKKYNNFEKACIYFYDVLKIDHSSLKNTVDNIKKIYIKALIEYKDLYSIQERISLSEIFYVDNYIKKFYMFDCKFDKFYKSNRITDSTRENIRHYSKILNNYDNIDERINIMERVIDKERLTFAHFDYFTKSDYRMYVHYNIVGLDKDENFKIRDIFNIENFVEDYMLILKRVCYGSYFYNRFGKDEKRIIEVSKKARFFNKINPSNVKMALTRGRTNIPTHEVNFINRYVDEYSVEYFDKKQSVNKVREEVKVTSNDDYLDKYILMVDGYVKSNIIIFSDYLETNDINQRDFNRAVEILKKYKHPLYDSFIAKKEDESKNYSKRNLEAAKKIAELIKNGVVINNKETRPFDIVDYYSITKVEPLTFYKNVSGRVGPNNVKYLSPFIKKYAHDYKVNNINDLLKMNFIFTVGKDEQENFIQVSATEEDKLKAIEYLKENEIVITPATYQTYLKRMIKENYKENNKVKKKN